MEVTPIRVIIVDDHQIMIDGLKMLLAGQSEIEVVGEALNGQKALTLLETQAADVAIVDINMPEMDGLALTIKLKEQHPDIHILVLTMFNESGRITDLLQAGADGYILKNTGKEELIAAIKKVSTGGAYFSTEVAHTMMNSVASQHQQEEEEEVANLSPRELEILGLIAKEYSNQEIAEELGISERTVETHRKNIFRKTATKSIVGLIKYAITHNLV